MDLWSANVEACKKVAACVWKSACPWGMPLLFLLQQLRLLLLLFLLDVTDYLQNYFACRYFFLCFCHSSALEASNVKSVRAC